MRFGIRRFILCRDVQKSRAEKEFGENSRSEHKKIFQKYHDNTFYFSFNLVVRTHIQIKRLWYAMKLKDRNGDFSNFGLS